MNTSQPLIKKCPFCGKKDVKVTVDNIRDKKHAFNGSEYCFPWCNSCGSRGPYFYKVDMSDEDAANQARQIWNKRIKMS